MRVLVIAPNWIGDAVMSLSLLQALHTDIGFQDEQGNPCEIHVMAPTVTAPVYQFSQSVHSVIVEPFVHGAFQLGLRRAVAKRIGTMKFDYAIVLPNSLKAALLPWLAGVPLRIGYSGELRSLILNGVLPKPDKLAKPPMVEWYGRLGDYSAEELENPVMKVSELAMEAACQAFGLTPGFLAVAPGAEYGPAKRWPAEHVAKVIKAFLLANPTQAAVVFGGPKDLDFSNSIWALVPNELRTNVHVLAGQTALPQAIELLGAASALLTNDSGLMHVGAALDVNVHAVYGSSSPRHTPPLNPTASVYYLKLDCSPCYQRVCPLGHTNCLVQLPPEMVIEGLVTDALRVSS